MNENAIEGRNVVIEAFRSGKTVDKLYLQDGLKDYTVSTILREAKKHGTYVNFVGKDRLDAMSETGKHQGVIAIVAAYEYASVEDILEKARQKNEPPMSAQTNHIPAFFSSCMVLFIFVTLATGV